MGRAWIRTPHPGPVARRLRRAPPGVGGRAPLAAGGALVAGAPARSPEDDCGLRTPLQRDRDRIVHCKAFRRLKHKTQVFVAPEGDHYRTRLTHTLEVTQISRTVARALAPQRGPHRGDRPRARPRPPAVRPHRRGRPRRVPARALRPRLPPLRALAAGRRRARARRRGPEPLRRRARRHPLPLGPRADAARRSRAGSCGSSTASRTSTTTSTTPCAPACCARTTCRRGRSRPRRHRLAADRHARPRPRRDLGGLDEVVHERVDPPRAGVAEDRDRPGRHLSSRSTPARTASSMSWLMYATRSTRRTMRPSSVRGSGAAARVGDDAVAQR